MSEITSKDFANEVKSDRLQILSLVTFGFCVALLIVVFIFGEWFWDNATISGVFTGSIIIGVGSLITLNFLRREQLVPSAWVYNLGWIVGVGILIYSNDTVFTRLAPFILPIITFLIGLMIFTSHTFILATLSSVSIIIAVYSSSAYESGLLGEHWFAIFLTFLSGALASQVSRKLYQITEWAISNSQRERRTNSKLFEKHKELESSLKQSQVLGEKLKEINQDLETARSSAEEAKHFRGQFLANMSHELRTPLNAIIGFSETMLKFPVMYDDQNLPKPYANDVNQIYESGRQLLFVINDILDLAKVDAGKLDIELRQVKIQPLINAVMSTSKGLLGSKDVQLKQDLPDPLPNVWADESRLRQIFLNLYSNACKYTDEGSIALKVETVEDKVQFSLTDTGIGIPDDYRKTIFEEFQQAKATGRDPRSGTGLGLAITKQLLELMDGEISVESEVGKGSTFTFTIPLYAGQDVAESQTKTDDSAQAEASSTPAEKKEHTDVTESVSQTLAETKPTPEIASASEGGA